MPLKTGIWVQAYIRRVFIAGAAAYVVRRGDPDAGAVLIVVESAEGRRLYAPAPWSGEEEGERRFRERVREAAGESGTVAGAIGREASFDPDLWVIEIEDREGRHFLDDAVEK